MEGPVTDSSASSAAMGEIFYSNMDSPQGIATLGLFALCFLNVLTTTLILSHGGFEMNPVIVPIVINPLLHILLKWFVVAFIAGVAAVADRMITRAGILIISVIITWYVYVVTHNLIVLPDFSVHN